MNVKCPCQMTRDDLFIDEMLLDSIDGQFMAPASR